MAQISSIAPVSRVLDPSWLGGRIRDRREFVPDATGLTRTNEPSTPEILLELDRTALAAGTQCMTSEATHKPKILVVDDEPDNLELLYRTFHPEFEVLLADSGQKALKVLAREPDIATIISDQRMPTMSGTELLSLTATQYPDIIRIILTAYTDVDDLVDAINSGKVFKYVTKPWNNRQLKAVVRQAIDTHNVLKTRTRDLCRTLRQESLLNAVINTIRSRTDHRQILQTIVETVGHMFEVSCCILRPFQDEQIGEEWFVYTGRSFPVESEAQREALVPVLARTVWETQDVTVINDVAADDRVSGDLASACRDAEIRSSLIVPLIAQQYDDPSQFSLLAVLALHQCGSPRTWQDDEVQLAVMVAEQAALTLSQARTYERMRLLAQRESLVNTITTAIRSSLEPQEIFAAITEQLGQAMAVDGCALSLWTEQDEFVQCVGLYDATDSSPQTCEGDCAGSHAVPIPSQSVVPIAGNPVLQTLLQRQDPVAIDNLDRHPELNVYDLPLRSPAKALLIVPLICEGDIIGSISLRQNYQPRPWKSFEIELAQAVASQAAIAVQHSRLYRETRQQAERLLELDRQKTEFFQNVSHEFRTPLTLTIGPLETAVSEGRDLPYEQAAIALRNSRRLLRLVNQLLDLQRLDAGRMQARFRPSNLAEFVAQTIESFRPYCHRKGLNLVADLHPCPQIYLDLEKFDKVLYNLLSNAMKFTPAGGTITVRVSAAGNRCFMQVKDTGIGIRADQMPELFERFRQAEGSASRSYEGSGLGLALVKELVELHGGKISVDSVYGKGSTFTVWLSAGSAHLPADRIIEVPAELQPSRASVELADLETELSSEPDRAASPELAIATDIPSETNGKAVFALPEPPSVLFVDDNPDLRTYVRGILTHQGYRVWLARNGAEGFEIARDRHPDLIVADLMMPLVSGLDMIRAIRADEALRGTPMILLTAKANEDTRIEGVEQGADAYLSKPFNDRELLAQVRNLIALKQNERRVAQLNAYLTESVLKRFLPESMVRKAAAGELALDLQPEPKLITIVFSDIVGFTELANTLRSRRVAEILNEYLAEMTEAVFEHGGTVDKFVGDAVMAIFGAPEEMNPNQQVQQAIAAVRQMHDRLDRLNQRWQDRGLDRVRFRCGIHQGTAVVGMFGGPERTDYTAIGPNVNIAARLQEATDPDTILVSAAVADYLDDEEIVKFQPLKFKGVDETVLTFIVHPEAKPSASVNS